jgi:hypothetical protein
MTAKGDPTVPEETLEEAWEAMLEEDRRRGRGRGSRRHATDADTSPAKGRLGHAMRLAAPLVVLALLVRRVLRRPRG